ncbi:hypothetical protein SARC_05608 [Sphaeroforma arctica JP610]|uniref:MABP domain-containing protein n=1 Tax=Sphaeroforma arctica JP610 TaxID=667725 RepID=A0A0L0G1P8_9EUKA|nr:hypothetical protein SARC_05608 [Sphaeroforma arctica JP610]KNC82098.1 hypothetical protein SARC_05608 [Sphaeroforma arctica JP610]|eukprot:XP_014156000.1 hypothetical protein SARC_05608 [Sphaeroforma arctica JP610]
MEEPVVSDIMLVKGVKCPKGYMLLNLSPKGHFASLTRKSYTRADIFLCVKMELEPTNIITDVTCIDMGKEPVPNGFTLVESRAGGVRTMVAVKRSPVDEASHMVTKICATLPKKEALDRDWRVHKKNLGDDVHLGYKRIVLSRGASTGGPPRPAQSPMASSQVPERPSSVYSSISQAGADESATSGLYPSVSGKPGMPSPVPVGAMWEEQPPVAQSRRNDLQYPALEGITVDFEAPESAAGLASSNADLSMKEMEMELPTPMDLSFDFSVETKYLQDQ